MKLRIIVLLKVHKTVKEKLFPGLSLKELEIIMILN